MECSWLGGSGVEVPTLMIGLVPDDGVLSFNPSSSSVLYSEGKLPSLCSNCARYRLSERSLLGWRGRYI